VANGVFQMTSSTTLSTVVNTLAIGTVGSSAWQVYAGNTNRSTTGFIPVLNTWTHVALSRVSGVTKFFVNGVQALSFADTTNYTASYLSVGAIYINGSYNWTGYIDEFRITPGIGRYTTAFTPQAQL
jgi:hypothetical protein